MQLNEVFIAGFLGRDAEVFSTKDGKLIVTLSLCTTIKEKSVWNKVKVFEPWANSAKEFRKGDNVFIKGSLSENKWTDKKTGQERSQIEILAFITTRLSRQEASRQSFIQGSSDIRESLEEAKFDLDEEIKLEDLPF